ncbi:hypothetical protein SLE2022_289700 [Rubroshorea leprosula]
MLGFHASRSEDPRGDNMQSRKLSGYIWFLYISCCSQHALSLDLDLIPSITSACTLKALADTSPGMEGIGSNRVRGRIKVPTR